MRTFLYEDNCKNRKWLNTLASLRVWFYDSSKLWDSKKRHCLRAPLTHATVRKQQKKYKLKWLIIESSHLATPSFWAITDSLSSTLWTAMMHKQSNSQNQLCLQKMHSDTRKTCQKKRKSNFYINWLCNLFNGNIFTCFIFVYIFTTSATML